MATAIIYSDLADGWISSEDGGALDYAAARAGTGGDIVVDTTATTLQIGQILNAGTEYRCQVAFLWFDVGAIPAGATIDAAELALWGVLAAGAVKPILQARTRNWGDTLASGDWVAGADLGALTLLATFDTTGFSTVGYNAFTETGTALRDAVAAALVGDGKVRLLVCSDLLVAGTPPADATERVVVRSADRVDTTNDPKLTITYTAPPVRQRPLVPLSGRRWVYL